MLTRTQYWLKYVGRKLGLDNLSVSTEAKLSSFAHSLQFYGIRQVGRAKDDNTSISGIVLAFCSC